MNRSVIFVQRKTNFNLQSNQHFFNQLRKIVNKRHTYATQTAIHGPAINSSQIQCITQAHLLERQITNEQVNLLENAIEKIN